MASVSAKPAAGRSGAAPAQRADQHRSLMARRSRILRARRRTEYAIGALLAGVVAAGMMAGWFFYAELILAPPPSADAAASDAFARTQVGTVRVPVAGITCREFSFDNRTGAFGPDTMVPCDRGAATDAAPALGASFESYRKAFGKR